MFIVCFDYTFDKVVLSFELLIVKPRAPKRRGNTAILGSNQMIAIQRRSHTSDQMQENKNLEDFFVSKRKSFHQKRYIIGTDKMSENQAAKTVISTILRSK